MKKEKKEEKIYDYHREADKLLNELFLEDEIFADRVLDNILKRDY